MPVSPRSMVPLLLLSLYTVPAMLPVTTETVKSLLVTRLAKPAPRMLKSLVYWLPATLPLV